MASTASASFPKALPKRGTAPTLSAAEVQRRLNQMTTVERLRVDAYIRHGFSSTRAAAELRCDRHTVKETFDRYRDCFHFVISASLGSENSVKS